MTAVGQAEMPVYRRLLQVFFSKLAKASAWLFLGSLAGGLLGYVFHVLVGRLLSTAEYGLFNAVMALFAVFSAGLGTLQMVVSRKVSEYKANRDTGSVRHFYFSVHRRTFIVGPVLLLLCVPLVPQAQDYLKSPGAGPVWLLGLLLILAVPAVLNDAFLQGLQKFSWLSASVTLRVVFKIVFAVALIALGFGVNGALGGTIVALLAAWLITYLPLRGPLADRSSAPAQTTHLSIRPAIPVLVANTAFAAMTQLDMVLVNHYFPSHEAGLYAAASVLGKAVMYLPGGIAMAMFPMVAENQARAQSSATLLAQAVGLTAAMCAAGAVFYFLFAEWIVTALYGPSYGGAGMVLKYFGFAIMPMGLVMVAEYFLIAKGRMLFAYLLMASAPLQLLAIHFYHDSLLTVVAILGASGLIVMLIGYGFLSWTFWKSRTERRA